MAGFNRITALGNLVADPEIKYTQSGTAVCTLRVAQTTKSKDGEETIFFDVDQWEKAAEIAAEYGRKGDLVLVHDGQLVMRKWQDRDGNDRQTPTIKWARVEYLGRRSQGGE